MTGKRAVNAATPGGDRIREKAGGDREAGGGREAGGDREAGGGREA